MNTQAIFNQILMIVMVFLVIADAVFIAVSTCTQKWSILIGALCGAMMVILIYGLNVLGNLPA